MRLSRFGVVMTSSNTGHEGKTTPLVNSKSLEKMRCASFGPCAPFARAARENQGRNANKKPAN